MNRTTALVTLAMLGLAGPAAAGDIDDVAPASLAATLGSENQREEGVEAQSRRGKPAGTRTTHTKTRTTTASPKGVKVTQSKSATTWTPGWT